METTPAIKNYIRSLTGEISLSLSGTAQEKEQASLEIIRYAVTDILHLEPATAAKTITTEELQLLALKPLLKHISAPAGIDAEKDIAYYIHKAFPEQVPYRISDQVLKKYGRIMEAKEKGIPQRFGRGQFTGKRGALELATLLMVLISQNIEYKNIGDLYRRFSDTSAMNTVFKTQWRIYDAVKSLYQTPLDCLHESLPESQKDDFLYGYYHFLNIYKSMSKE